MVQYLQQLVLSNLEELNGQLKERGEDVSGLQVRNGGKEGGREGGREGETKTGREGKVKMKKTAITTGSSGE